ncbi:hypothetical protein GQ457_07G005090 [Hibiscus cannabinus]
MTKHMTSLELLAKFGNTFPKLAKIAQPNFPEQGKSAQRGRVWATRVLTLMLCRLLDQTLEQLECLINLYYDALEASKSRKNVEVQEELRIYVLPHDVEQVHLFKTTSIWGKDVRLRQILSRKRVKEIRNQSDTMIKSFGPSMSHSDTMKKSIGESFRHDDKSFGPSASYSDMMLKSFGPSANTMKNSIGESFRHDDKVLRVISELFRHDVKIIRAIGESFRHDDKGHRRVIPTR